MMWAYGFLNARLVCLRATPARCVTSSNHRSEGTEAPPPRHATTISSSATPAFCMRFEPARPLSRYVSFFHERIGTLGNLYYPVPCHVLKFLHDSRLGPLH